MNPRPRQVRRNRPLAVAATTAAAALLLASCGSTAPGVAARVGEDRIEDSEVDEFARVLCALNTTPGAEASIPTRSVRHNALQILLGNALAAEVADLDAVDPDDVATAVTQANATRELVPERLQDTFDDVVLGYAVAQYAIIDLGRSSLAEQGQDPEAVTEDAAYAEGDRLRQEYAQSSAVEVDPRFGRMVDGVLQPADGSLSVPVSEFAVGVSAAEGDENATAALPASQKCS